GHPYRFLLDTGAAKSCVVFDDYTSTFASTEKNNSSGVFAKSSEDLITVPTIEVGSISKKNFTVVRKGDKAPDIRSLIGMDLLKDFCCHFFFDENRVSVDTNEESSAEYPLLDLFLDNRFHPYVDVQFPLAKAKAAWDTGASITIVDTNFVKKHPPFFQEVGQSTGTDATGFQMETPMYIMSATVIGNHDFPPHKVAGVDLSRVNSTIEVPMDLILGYSTLSQAHWLFDFPRKKWAISKRLGV
ncbi:MAG: aspartyl protease family protein, partial [Chloroflexi bacterium]|nr:aspartyl protease family protein [Chloroflexota bacterium]